MTYSYYNTFYNDIWFDVPSKGKCIIFVTKHHGTVKTPREVMLSDEPVLLDNINENSNILLTNKHPDM